MQMEMLCALRIVLLLDLKRHGSPVGSFFWDVAGVYYCKYRCQQQSCSLHFRPRHCGPFTAAQPGRSGSIRSTDLQSSPPLLSLSSPPRL